MYPFYNLENKNFTFSHYLHFPVECKIYFVYSKGDDITGSTWSSLSTNHILRLLKRIIIVIISALVNEIYSAQKQRDIAMMGRIKLANEQRDEAVSRLQKIEQMQDEWV